MAFLSNLVASYLSNTAKNHFRHTLSQGIYHNDRMVVLKGKKTVQDIRDWLGVFQKIVNQTLVNQHLEFISEVWTSNLNITPTENNSNINICTAKKIPFLDMNMSCSPKVDLQFGVLVNKGHQLK